MKTEVVLNEEYIRDIFPQDELYAEDISRIISFVTERHTIPYGSASPLRNDLDNLIMVKNFLRHDAFSLSNPKVDTQAAYHISVSCIMSYLLLEGIQKSVRFVRENNSKRSK